MLIVRRDSAIQLAPVTEFRPTEQIDFQNIKKFILFLKMPGLNIGNLQLDLQLDLAPRTEDLDELFAAIDALASPPEFQIKVNGQSESQLPSEICRAFAKSKICLSTCNIRNWTLTSILGLHAGEETQEHKRASKLIEALLVAPNLEPDTHIDELAHLALDCEYIPLLMAVHTLAPNYQIKIEKVPRPMQCAALEASKVPCVFRLNLTSADFEKFTWYLNNFGSFRIFTDMSLTIAENIDEKSATEFIKGLTQLPAIKYLYLAIKSGVSLKDLDLEVSSQSHDVKALVFNAEQAEDADYIQFLRILNRALMPSTLSIRVGTPGAAANIVKTISEQKTDGMIQLSITCTTPFDSGGGAELVAAIEDLLRKPDCPRLIVVRSQAQLLADPQQEAKFKLMARSHAPEVRIRMEHFSSSNGLWQTGLSIDPMPASLSMKPLDCILAPQPRMAMPKQLGRPDGRREGLRLNLSPQRPGKSLNLSSQNLRGSRPADKPRRDLAIQIASKLNSEELDASALTARLTLDGRLDAALVDGVRFRLYEMAGTGRATQVQTSRSLALLDSVWRRDGS